MNVPAHVDIRVTQRFDAPADRVFNAWLDPGLAGRWLFATATRPAERVAIDPRVGGTFSFVERRNGANIDHAGKYTEIRRPRRIGFTLSGRSRVRVEIAPDENGCTLTLLHRSVAAHEAGHIEGRWTGMLYGLSAMLERDS